MQATVTLDEIIASHPFLSGLERRFLNLLEPCASLRRFSAHQLIFHEGGEADHFYLILCGKVSLQTQLPERGALTVQTLETGDALGWSWLYPPYTWCFTAVSMAPTEVISFGAGFLRERAEEDIEFANELLRRVGKTIVERLQIVRKELIEASSLQTKGFTVTPQSFNYPREARA